MAKIHNVPAPSQYGKIWRYAAISFLIIVAAAILYWIGEGMAAHPTQSDTTQGAINASRGPAQPTIN
ncbi:MAG: hypothetical protein ACTHLA_09730 [Asticcacaulis sp.]|uniref:hypothetical protein n=1 Tax=Asticcacaulis sp. TaxID=1872648 RepID=UPI003F7B99BE